MIHPWVGRSSKAQTLIKVVYYDRTTGKLRDNKRVREEPISAIIFIESRTWTFILMNHAFEPK